MSSSFTQASDGRPALIGALLRMPVDRAEEAGMTRQAMNYLLGQLEALGYLERHVDPDDVRSRRVYLTERGTSTISVIRDAVTELETAWETKLGTKDWQ